MPGGVEGSRRSVEREKGRKRLEEMKVQTMRRNCVREWRQLWKWDIKKIYATAIW